MSNENLDVSRVRLLSLRAASQLESALPFFWLGSVFLCDAGLFQRDPSGMFQHRVLGRVNELDNIDCIAVPLKGTVDVIDGHLKCLQTWFPLNFRYRRCNRWLELSEEQIALLYGEPDSAAKPSGCLILFDQCIQRCTVNAAGWKMGFAHP